MVNFWGRGSKSTDEIWVRTIPNSDLVGTTISRNSNIFLGRKNLIIQNPTFTELPRRALATVNAAVSATAKANQASAVASQVST